MAITSESRRITMKSIFHPRGCGELALYSVVKEQERTVQCSWTVCVRRRPKQRPAESKESGISGTLSSPSAKDGAYRRGPH